MTANALLKPSLWRRSTLSTFGRSQGGPSPKGWRTTFARSARSSAHLLPDRPSRLALPPHPSPYLSHPGCPAVTAVDPARTVLVIPTVPAIPTEPGIIPVEDRVWSRLLADAGPRTG